MLEFYDQCAHVALNYRLASALLLPKYSQVFLSERLLLGSHTAMLVHALLSTCLGRGNPLENRCAVAPNLLVGIERTCALGTPFSRSSHGHPPRACFPLDRHAAKQTSASPFENENASRNGESRTSSTEHFQTVS